MQQNFALNQERESRMAEETAKAVEKMDIKGEDAEAAAMKKKEREERKKAQKAAKAAKMAAKKKEGAKRAKKQLSKGKGLGIQCAKAEDFSEWYQQVITLSEMIEYYPVSGCYVLRPMSFTIWENIQAFLDTKFKSLGVRNCYFPMFVTKGQLEVEETHIADFAPEVAWVTKSGKTDLQEPIAIRPTSETVMYPSYAKWIRSHRDLPLKLNQWCNIVRWEFKHPTPFLRTREFLWQEGHTAFSNKADAEEEVFQVLDFYAAVYEELLAVPVVRGRKSEKEKFAGGDFTTTVEALIPTNGRAIQGATSHHLGQNFAKMFHIEFEGEDGKTAMVHQNSWGMTTRTIGVVIMVHGDDKGLVLPPRVAPIQYVVIPIIGKKKGDASEAIIQKAKDIHAMLTAAGLRGEADCGLNHNAGWKFNHWELKGVPIRIELGPKDMEKQCVVMVRRDTGKKEFDVSWDGLVDTCKDRLEIIQKDMYAKALQVRDAQMVKAETWEDFGVKLQARNIVLVPWCNEIHCEEDIKERSGKLSDEIEVGEGGEQLSGSAKCLCIPLEQESLKEGASCFACGKPATCTGLFGRSY